MGDWPPRLKEASLGRQTRGSGTTGKVVLRLKRLLGGGHRVRRIRDCVRLRHLSGLEMCKRCPQEGDAVVMVPDVGGMFCGDGCRCLDGHECRDLFVAHSDDLLKVQDARRKIRRGGVWMKLAAL